MANPNCEFGIAGCDCIQPKATETAPPAPETKFKVGQWVFRTQQELGMPVGTLGRITEIRDDRVFPYLVDWNWINKYGSPAIGWGEADKYLSLTPPASLSHVIF